MKVHVNSHIVSIHRLGTFLSRAQAKTSETFFSSNKEGVGGYFEKGTSHKIGSGLTLNEEKLLLPEIIDTPADDRDFRKKVSEFFNELNTDVPADTGTDMEIGLLKDNSQPVSEDNMPINIMDFIRYRHALGHPWVTASKEVGEGNMTKKWYIFDKDALQTKKTETGKEKDAAMEIFLKVKKEPEQVDQMLTLMGEDIRNYAKDKNAPQRKEDQLRLLLDAKPVDFKRIYEEGDLEVRSWIESMVLTGVLKKIGKRIIDPEAADEANSELGVNLDKAIFWFKDENNSGAVATLKARRQEAMSQVPEKEIRKTIV